MYYGNNNLVSNQFTPDSFDIVRKVYEHLGILKYIENKLPEISFLNNSIYKVEELHKYFTDIQRVTLELDTLIELNRNLPIIKDIAPRISEFKEKLDDILEREDRRNFSMNQTISELNSSIKLNEDLFVQYECGLKDLIGTVQYELDEFISKFKDELDSKYNDILDKHSKIEYMYQNLYEFMQYIPLIVHLKAADLTEKAIYTGLLEDKYKAIDAINMSVSKGNNEDYLHSLLESVNYRRGNHES